MRARAGDPVALQLDAVIIVEIVDADDPLAAREQALADMMTDESGGAGDEDGH